MVSIGSVLFIVAAVIFGWQAARQDSWVLLGFCLFAAGHVVDGVIGWAKGRKAGTP